MRDYGIAGGANTGLCSWNSGVEATWRSSLIWYLVSLYCSLKKLWVPECWCYSGMCLMKVFTVVSISFMLLSYTRPWQGQSKRMWHGISRYEHSLCPLPRTPMDGTALYQYTGVVEEMNHEPSCVHHYDRHTISLHSKINFHFHFKRTWSIWPFHFNICDGLHFTITISITVYHVRFLLIATTKFTVGKCFNLTCLYFKGVWWS